MLVSIRKLRLPEDASLVLSLNTSFTTSKTYQIESRADGFSLNEVNDYITKTYSFDLQSDEFHASNCCAMVAENGMTIIGVCSVEFQHWNRRAILHHLYVDVDHRGIGAGKLLLDASVVWAAESGARCLWVETQNINHSAIQFYTRHGFQLCGCDTSLYDPDTVLAGETALYFSLSLPYLPQQLGAIL